ncbi:MAG: PQQ-binding-like beta-propeller repeat protein [Planctomycetes bacterium]|nr:PQQ-binding-like beta-propeller repeat protein [Planctomycetota bacterium]
MLHFPRLTLVFPVALLLLSATVHAENWPGWRGPRGDGSSLEEGVPTRWSSTENVAWKVAVPYIGHASPVIWNDHLFLVGTDLQKADRNLSAFDRKTGKLLWNRTVVNSPLEGKHRLNSFASSTPVTDGKSVFVSFLDHGQMCIAAYDFAGNEQWTVRPGIFSSVHGYCSSPILFEDKIIINGDHDGDAYLVALEQATGRTVWKTPRENRTRSYCTPIIRDIDGRTQMVLSGSKCVASYDPRTGLRHWIIDGPTEQFVASLVYSHDRLFVTGGFPEHHVLSIDPHGTGNVTKTHVGWHHTGKLASYVPSPIVLGDYFLIVSDDELATCLDAKSGKEQWQKKLSRHSSASLVSAGGLVYFLDDFGVTQVIKPGPSFDVVAVNRLLDEAEGQQEADLCSASPAISQGQLFIRSDKFLFCIGDTKRAAGGK